MSCGAEMAVAKYLNLYWSGALGDYKARDVGGMVEVRARSSMDWDLLVHPEDADDLPFVLVVPQPPIFVIRGWMFARDAKQSQFWSDPARGRAAFFVPVDKLRPMSELKDWVRDPFNMVVDPVDPDAVEARPAGPDFEAMPYDGEESETLPAVPMPRLPAFLRRSRLMQPRNVADTDESPAPPGP